MLFKFYPCVYRSYSAKRAQVLQNKLKFKYSNAGKVSEKEKKSKSIVISTMRCLQAFNFCRADAFIVSLRFSSAVSVRRYLNYHLIGIIEEIFLDGVLRTVQCLTDFDILKAFTFEHLHFLQRCGLHCTAVQLKQHFL